MFDDRYFIIRDAAFGRDFTPKLWVALIALGLVLWDLRTQRRRDYLWVFLIGTIIWAGAEALLAIQGVRDMPDRVLFGRPLSLSASYLLQGMGEGAFIAVVGLFVGDRLLVPAHRRRAVLGFVLLCALITAATIRSAQRLGGDEVVASRRDVGATMSLVALAVLALIAAWFLISWQGWRPRAAAMFAVMVAVSAIWTIGQVAVGGRWVETAASGGYERASALVTGLVLAFDVVVEIAVAYLPFLALPVMAGLVTDERPLVRSSGGTTSAASTPSG